MFFGECADTPLRVRSTIKTKSRDRLMVERAFFASDRDMTAPDQIHSLIAESWIEPSHHPQTDPAATI